MEAVERLPVIHSSVDFIFLSFGSWILLLNFETVTGSIMRPKCPKLANLEKNYLHSLQAQFFGVFFASNG